MSRIVVIGAGVAELVAAEYLSRAGRDVIVIDERDGATEDTLGWIPADVERDLDLAAHGLKREPGESCVTHEMLSGRDAARWPRFCERMRALGELLEALYSKPPPDLFTSSLAGLTTLGASALRARGLGPEGLGDLLRVLPISAADWLDEWFDSDPVKAALGLASVRNLAQGPRSGGTAFNLLHQHVGNAPGVFGELRSNAAQVLRNMGSARLRGGRVSRIDVRQGSVRSVTLASGETIETSTVACGAHPFRTLVELGDPGWFDPELVRAVRNLRGRGVAAHVLATCAAQPAVRALWLAPSLDAIERAYDDYKHGRISAAPVMKARIDGDRIGVHVQYVPADIRDADHEVARERLAKATFAALSPHVAGLKIERVLLPQDLEARHGWPDGQPHHAEIALDQMLWMRPVPQLAQYATPVRGLYLCGPAMHPGIPALTGRNAAAAVLRGRV